MLSIKKYRGLKNISQIDLAAKIGVSRQYMSTLEAKDAVVAAKQVKKIANALEVSPIKIYGLDNFKIKPTTREDKEFLIDLLQKDLRGEV